MHQIKYIFISGGVVSSLGKGLTAASIAMLLESRGLKVAMLKLDPYLNVDPGTMNPFQHGEVYVTDDGAETDLDFGHYYRYTNAPISRLPMRLLAKSTMLLSNGSAKAIIWGKPFRSSPMSPMKSNSGFCVRKQEPIPMSSSSKLAALSAILNRCPFFEAIRQFRYERPKIASIST